MSARLDQLFERHRDGALTSDEIGELGTLLDDVGERRAWRRLMAFDGALRDALAPMAWSPQAVIETALADVQASKAGWTEADLISAINAALPDYLGTPDGRDVGELFDQLAAEALRYATSLDTARPG
ncbi:MAG: hypothetical protein H0X45_04015, partial [Planctomycetes bacterium]|nr:hypothetical protein [Planctomycetota bacterium]